MPKVMLSDNATIFCEAAREIELLTSSSPVRDSLNKTGTTWNFIPKRAPLYGGYWEDSSD